MKPVKYWYPTGLVLVMLECARRTETYTKNDYNPSVSAPAASVHKVVPDQCGCMMGPAGSPGVPGVPGLHGNRGRDGNKGDKGDLGEKGGEGQHGKM